MHFTLTFLRRGGVMAALPRVAATCCERTHTLSATVLRRHFVSVSLVRMRAITVPSSYDQTDMNLSPSSPLAHYLLYRARLAPPGTQTTEEERAYLASVAAGKTIVVEIGVWHGVTTSVLRRAMAPSGTLYAVDPYPAGRLGVNLQEPIAKRHVARNSTGKVEWVRGTGDGAAQMLSHLKPELVFIDGDHTYVGAKRDWDAWSPLMPKGGVIAMHDTRIRALDESARLAREISATDPRFRVSAEVHSITAFERI